MNNPIELQDAIERVRDAMISTLVLSGKDMTVEEVEALAIAALSVSGDMRRVCDVCTATVATFDEAMRCHCMTIPWRAALSPQQKDRDGE